MSITLCDDERLQLDQQGFVLCRGVLSPAELTFLRLALDAQWAAAPVGTGKIGQHTLLADPHLRSLPEHPAVLGRHRSLFGDQVQLLSFDLLRQGPFSSFPERVWHRDFTFPGDYLIAANTILYFDDITEESGPTWVVPGSHRGRGLPPPTRCRQALPGEVAICARAGDAAIINAAVWHSGGRNRGPGQRRAAYLYYGHWWLKQYDRERGPLPWPTGDESDPMRRALFGQRMPANDIHMY